MREKTQVPCRLAAVASVNRLYTQLPLIQIKENNACRYHLLLSLETSEEDDMRVKDVMHRGSIHVEPTASVREVAKRMRDADVGAIPVTTNGHLIGIVTDRDITCRALAHDSDVTKMTAKDIMTKDVEYCSPEDDIDAVLEVMEKRKIRRLPVADSHKAIVGMLSLGDISHKVSRDAAGEVLCAVSAHHA